jgi:methyltransferase (TIGR00027 family)
VKATTHSQTALTAAAARAAHLIVDREPVIFADTLAEALLGADAGTLLDYHRNNGDHPILAGARTQVTIRSRLAEAAVADGAANGITQYIVVGAGLDSFAYRGGTAERVATFEVDHPASGAWKRDRLADAGIAVPEQVTFAAADLETESLADALARTGFDRTRPAVVSWLGVTMYLTRDAIADTLGVIGALPAGTTLVADYMQVPALRDEAGREYGERISAFSAERGEPWRSSFHPDEMSNMLAEAGFGQVRHIRQEDLDGLWDRTDALRPARLSVLAHAITGPAR